MLDMRHVDANLMRAARFEPQSQETVRRETRQHPVMCHGQFALVRDGLFDALGRMPADRRVDMPAGRNPAGANGAVFARDLPLFECADQLRMRRQCPRNQQQAARVLVEPVQDTAAGQVGQFGIVMQQAV